MPVVLNNDRLEQRVVSSPDINGQRPPPRSPDVAGLNRIGHRKTDVLVLGGMSGELGGVTATSVTITGDRHCDSLAPPATNVMISARRSRLCPTVCRRVLSRSRPRMAGQSLQHPARRLEPSTSRTIWQTGMTIPPRTKTKTRAAFMCSGELYTVSAHR